MGQGLFLDASLFTALLVTWLPFVAFVVIMVALRRAPKGAAAVSIATIIVAVGGALHLVVKHWAMQAPIRYAGKWLVSGSITIPFGFLLDPLSLLMLTIVAVICALVQIYSLGYMAGDPGFARYYGFMSLFAWAMMSLAVSPSMLQLYVFWELVGLASYLLIGFWYGKFSASEAGKKAFVMTRLGDVALMLGILLVLIHYGNLDILNMNHPEVARHMSQGLITVSALLIFGGVIGKSAQFPLLTWLPDAMEGPTPVSALLHSATMVAAGVFMFARLFPFFSLSPTAMTVCLAIGTISMLLASTMAMVSRDIKQVWAYSTISQLGYMIMGLAAGGYFAGVFHLTTHAAFKALLFLCSGVLIHIYHTNDMFVMGRKGARHIKLPVGCMALAAAALAGLPPLSGFFSKELILGALAELDNPLWLAAGLFGAFLTAYYAFRLLFILWRPFTREAPQEEDTSKGHATGTEGVMLWPLLVLAAFTLVLGFAQSDLQHWIENIRGGAQLPTPAHHAWLPIAALTAGFSGVGLAWYEFGRRGAAQVGFVERVAGLKALFANRWYIDCIYRYLLDTVVYRGISFICTQNDRQVIDRSLDALGRGTRGTSRALSHWHTGMIQFRLVVLFVVMVLLALYFFV